MYVWYYPNKPKRSGTSTSANLMHYLLKEYFLNPRQNQTVLVFCVSGRDIGYIIILIGHCVRYMLNPRSKFITLIWEFICVSDFTSILNVVCICASLELQRVTTGKAILSGKCLLILSHISHSYPALTSARRTVSNNSHIHLTGVKFRVSLLCSICPINRLFYVKITKRSRFCPLELIWHISQNMHAL